MAQDLNRWVGIGRLSSDVELKVIPSGTAVARFGLAVGGRPKQDGASTVSFFNVVVWGKLAELCGQHIRKGKQVAIDGRLEQKTWTTQDGQKRSTVEIVAEHVEFLSDPKNQTAQEPRKAPETTSTPGSDSFYDSVMDSFDATPLEVPQDIGF